MPKFIDITGRRYGSLTVLNRAPNNGKRVIWMCLCDCGNQHAIRAHAITSGHTVSCGCIGSVRYKHDQSTSRAYRIWVGMKGRCLNSNNTSFGRYSVLGICARWLVFENFLADMGHPPDGTSIDRIDGNRGYQPGNCRWATNAQQARNKRSNINVTWQGETMCLSDWSSRLGVNVPTLYQRIVRSGWTLDRAFTRPVTKFGDRQPRLATSR